MTFREDMYSLLYVSLVRPEYKIYCDLVAKHGPGHTLPNDENEPLKSMNTDLRSDTLTEEEIGSSWCAKVKSFVCCRRPQFDEEGNHGWITTKTLILDVISSPLKRETVSSPKNTQIAVADFPEPNVEPIANLSSLNNS